MIMIVMIKNIFAYHTRLKNIEVLIEFWLKHTSSCDIPDSTAENNYEVIMLVALIHHQYFRRLTGFVFDTVRKCDYMFIYTCSTKPVLIMKSYTLLK